MKRYLAGIVIMVTLLGVSIGTTLAINRLHSGIAGELSQAAELAFTDWDAAQALALDAWEDWEKGRNFTAALSDHAILEEMEARFRELGLYTQQQMAAEFAAVCLHLSCGAEAIAESHCLTWWNLL